MENEHKIAKIKELLLAKGYKFTPPRKNMVRLFVESKQHLKPEEIYKQTRDKNISLPTIYRTIDILKKVGVIKEVVIDHDRYYELNIYNQKQLHIHFHCKQCGQIKEYYDNHIFKDLIDLRNYIEEKFMDEIEDIAIVMSGLCVSCKSSHKSDKTEMTD